MPGAQDALHQLNGYPKCVATARAPEMEVTTSGKLKEFFGEFRQFYFGYKERKAEAVLHAKGQYVIDDSLHECQLVHDLCPNVCTILFPMRHRYDTPVVPGIRQLKAQQDVRRGIGDDDWHGVCQAAWKETVDIILNHN